MSKGNTWDYLRGLAEDINHYASKFEIDNSIYREFVHEVLSGMKGTKVKYSLTAEANGRKCDCGSISNDPIILALYYLVSGNAYSSGKGVTNVSVLVNTNNTGNSNVNASTSWLSASQNLGGATSGSFTLKFSTTMAGSVPSGSTVTLLSLGWTWSQNSSGSAYSFSLVINTQGGTACNVTVNAGTVVTWTLSGSVTEGNSSATASWYVYLWNELWAELLNATGLTSLGVWQYPSAGTALLSKITIAVLDPNNNVIGSQNYGSTSPANISNVSVNPGSSTGLTSTPSVTFTLTPTSSDTINSVLVSFDLNGSSPSTVNTEVAASGALQAEIGSINQSVSANTPYQISVADSISVSGST